ncbi:hypothetical protein KPATCC21470_4657 [Kitasatospora purpeofusca]
MDGGVLLAQQRHGLVDQWQRPGAVGRVEAQLGEVRQHPGGVVALAALAEELPCGGEPLLRLLEPAEPPQRPPPVPVQQRTGPRHIGGAVVGRADPAQQPVRLLEALQGLPEPPLPQPQQPQRLDRRRPAARVPGQGLVLRGRQQLAFRLLVLPQLHEGEGELDAHPAGRPGPRAVPAGRPSPGPQRGQQNIVAAGLQLRGPERLDGLAHGVEAAELLGGEHGFHQIARLGDQRGDRRPLVLVRPRAQLGVQRAEVPTFLQRRVVGADGEPQVPVRGARHGRGATRQAVLTGRRLLRVRTHRRTVPVATVPGALQQLELGQFGQRPPRVVLRDLGRRRHHGRAQRGPRPQRPEPVDPRRLRPEPPVGLLGDRPHRTLRRGIRPLAAAERPRRQVRGHGPQRERGAGTPLQHRGKRGAGRRHRGPPRQFGQQPLGVLVGQRAHGDGDRVQPGERTTRDDQREHAGRRRDQRIDLGRRLRVVEHDQQPPTGQQGTEEVDPVLHGGRNVLRRHAQAQQEVPQDRRGRRSGARRTAPEIRVQGPVREPPGLAAAPVEGERTGTDPRRTVQDGHLRQTVGLAVRLPVQQRQRPLPVGEEPRRSRQRPRHPVRRRPAGTPPTHHRGEHPRLLGTAQRLRHEQPRHRLPLGHPHRRRHLPPHHPGHQPAHRLPGPLPRLVGHPRPGRTQESRHHRQRQRIHRPTPGPP